MALPLAALGLLGGGLLGGGLLGGGKGLSKFAFGDPARERQFQKFTPEQQSILDQLLRQGAQESDFSGLEQMARKRFEEETVPSIAERFTAMGDGQRSSAFQSALGRAGTGLETQLAALRSQAGMQKLGMGLQPRFDTGYSPATQGALGAGLPSIMSLLPMLKGLL